MRSMKEEMKKNDDQHECNDGSINEDKNSDESNGKSDVKSKKNQYDNTVAVGLSEVKSEKN